MAEHLITGIIGEDQAAAYLQQQGFIIRERNYRYKKAEIDLIVQAGNLLVFVEVKTRTTNKFGYPEEFVSQKKTQLFILAADEYVHQINWQHDLRFDIIAITASGNQYHIHHIEDAFH